MSIDATLGRDYMMSRWDGNYCVQSRVTVVGFDPEKGWRLHSAIHGSTWVPRKMWRELLTSGVLVAA